MSEQVCVLLSIALVLSSPADSEDLRQDAGGPVPPEAQRDEDLTHSQMVLPVRFLLSDARVQDALELSDLTRNEIRDRLLVHLRKRHTARNVLEQKLAGPGHSGRDKIRNSGNDDWKQKLVREYFAEQKQETARAEHDLLALLDLSERARLDQMNLRLVGVSGLLWPSTARLLELRDEQLAQLRRVRSRQAAMMAELNHRLRDGEITRESLKAQAIEIHRRSVAQGLEILNDQQREQFRIKCGASVGFTRFDLSRELRLRHVQNPAGTE